MKKISLVLIVICPILLISQSIKGFKIPDSLKNKSAEYLESYYDKVFQVDNDMAEVYANIILSKGKKEKNKNLIFDGYFKIARTKNSKGENGHPFADSLMAITKNVNHIDYPAKSYILKGILFNNENRYQDALAQYTKALELNKPENKEQFYHLKKLIAILKTETEEYKEALSLFSEYYQYEKSIINTKSKNEKDYISSIFALTNIYAKSKEYKKSIQFADLGLSESEKYNNRSFYHYLLLIKGIDFYYLKNYNSSYRILSDIEKDFKKNKDYINLGILYYFLGKIKHETNKENEAVEFFKKTDSISFAINSFEPIKRDGYEILIDYYKKKKDLNNQLTYINKLIYSDSAIAADRKNLSKEILKNYDTPILIKEKEGLIKKLNNQNTFYIGLISLLAIITLLFIYIIRRSRKKIKEYEQQAKVLLEKPSVASTFVSQNEIEFSNNNLTETERSNRDDLLADPRFKVIIGKIEQFENSNGFLKKNITLNTLSKDFDTNRDYLSRLINELKGKNFSQYLNDLRINYIVEELKSNEKIRKHTIAAMADDIGFNNSESFTNAFKKITGTLPSYYIKLLNEEQ